MIHLRLSLIAVCVLLSACPATSVKPPPTEKPLSSIEAPDTRGAKIFRVDPNASSVSIHVFRGGTLARLGHNHVMTSKHLAGRAWTRSAFERSGFELQFSVAELIVDDPQARRAAGAEFPGEISPEDREGTRKNMLRAEVLDAERYPTIQLRSVRMSGTPAAAQLTTRITIKGVSHDVVIPAQIAIDGERLSATGEFDLRQTDFGIKPFSIALGALEVQDRLHLVFEIVANAE